MVEILRFPLVAFAFVVQHLRRLPGGRLVARRASLVTTGLLLVAFVAFVAWGLQRAPQRVGLAELASGALSPMQSWIIISGELHEETSRTSDFRYRLADPAVPNATMIVVSSVELPVGPMTVSGTFLGPGERVPAGHRWVGQMRADPVMAQDLPPPWIAMVLAVAGVLVGAAGLVSYPMFFGQTPRSAAPPAMKVQVGIRRGPLATAGQVVPGTLDLQPGAPAGLSGSDADTETLRLHSVLTGAEVGELRHLASSEPALRLRRASEELTLSFASEDERDAAFAALLADAAQWSRDLAPSERVGAGILGRRT